MRILFLNNFCGHYGGVEQVVAHTASALARRGHACHLAYGVARPDSTEFSALFASATRCTEFGWPGESGECFSTIAGRVKPDVVFVHKLAQLPAGMENSPAFRKVVLVHDHDLWCPTGLGYTRHNRKTCTHAAGWHCYLALAFLEKAEGGKLPVKLVNVGDRLRAMARYHTFDAVLANSTFIRDRLQAGGFPADRLHLCHPVLEQGEPGVTPVPEAPEILYVGSLIRGKGVDLLLRALRRVAHPWKLTIVGRGKSEDELKALAQSLGIAAHINFAGWVPNDEVGAYYRRARVVAVPSCWPEPFGLVGLEAMRHGRPVAAFAVGGIPDWLADNETGLLSPEQDVAHYGRSLERLLSDETLAQRLGAGGAARVRSQFAFGGYLDRIERHLAGSH